ncbi:MAG: lipocalin-like domain-containing protein [Acidobacteria bacterium]|nr:lipocalin-like domain-containing protein [Acidobacteriota bacterium]
MRITSALVLALAVLVGLQVSSVLTAQGSPGGTQPLVGTWQLVDLERGMPTQPLSRVANPVGILTQSANGYMIETVTQAARPASLTAAERFMTYRGHWGTFTVDASQPAVSYHIEGHLDPGRTGQRFVRLFQRFTTSSEPRIRRRLAGRSYGISRSTARR